MSCQPVRAPWDIVKALAHASLSISVSTTLLCEKYPLSHHMLFATIRDVQCLSATFVPSPNSAGLSEACTSLPHNFSDQKCNKYIALPQLSPAIYTSVVLPLHLVAGLAWPSRSDRQQVLGGPGLEV